MTSSVKFTILGQPCSKANSREIVTINNHPSSIKSKEARRYERDAGRQLPAKVLVMYEGPVRVDIHCFYSWQGPDLDVSIILDVLQAQFQTVHGKHVNLGEGRWGKGEKSRIMTRPGVYKNDRQVREMHLFHAIDKANPRAEIEVSPLQPQQIQVPLLPHVSRETEPEPF